MRVKIFDLGPLWTGKTSFADFFVFTKIFTKNVCPHSQWQSRHGFNIVNSQRLRVHGISVVNNYAHMQEIILEKVTKVTNKVTIFLRNIFFIFRFTAHLGEGIILYCIVCITVWSAAPQTTLWGGPRPRFEPRTGDLEARTLTTRPPHLLQFSKIGCPHSRWCQRSQRLGWHVLV